MPALTINQRVQRHRDALRQAGLRPVQIWVPDTRRPGQGQLIAGTEKDDAELETFMNAAAEDLLADLDAWEE